MNIEAAAMNVPYREALASYKAYRTAVKTKPPGDPAHKASRDDVMLFRALRALLRGHKVIDINLAIGSAGRDQQGRPRLAIGRADWHTVDCQGSGSGFTFKRAAHWRKERGNLTVPLPTFGALPTGAPSAWQIGCTAKVPFIPPQHRPDGDLADYHILWEAEWQNQPPGDPLLLKKVDGPFFVVLAAWDLTPLEQAVLRQRL